tara:strand:+ start:2335 stop:3288 length:954 start_codon:yes stop_codon:yes gene_type:complete
MSIWTAAAKGAAAGARTGSALGGFGTLAGAGIGAIAGGVAGGPSEAQLLEEKRMAELMRRQELGTLGYTDEQMNVALNQEQGALSQQQQAQAAQQASLLATTGVGAGAYLKGQQEADAIAKYEMVVARQKAEERGGVEQRAQEKELQQLAGLAERRQELEREAMISSLIDVSGQVTDAGIDFFKAEETSRKAEAMAKKEDDVAVARLKTQRGGQDAAAVRAQQSMHDNTAPTAPDAQGISFKKDMAMIQNAQAIQDPDGLFPTIPGAQGLSPYALQLIQRIQMTEGPAAAQAVMTKLSASREDLAPLMQQMMLRGGL